MKNILVTLFLTFLCFKMTAQVAADLATHNAVNDSLITLYNKQAFEEPYNFLSSKMQEQLTKADWVALLSDNIYQTLGKVTKTEYLEKSRGMQQYKWVFDRSALQVSYFVSPKKIIEGIFFKPFTEKPKKRTVAAATNNPLKSALDKTVDSIAVSYIGQSNTAGLSIGVLQNGQFFTYHYGEMDKKSPKLPNDNTFYEIGSITKTFTGTLLAQAILDKKIQLDDDIRLHLPEKYPNLEFNGQPILIKHLTNHTSGLISFPSEDISKQAGYDPINPYKHYTKEMVLAYLHTVKMDTFAGLKSAYSNFATGLLGIILEKKYQMSYEDMVKKYAAGPLSMDATKIKIGAKDSINFAKPHDETGKQSSYWDITGLGAAGAIRSTISDMLKYAKANMEAANPAMRLAQKATFRDRPENEIGLFWQLSTTKKGQLMTWHNGGTGGFTSFCGFMKAQNIAVVMLSNCSSDVTQKGVDLLKKLAE
jgi:CubicO group peptidase (beta-lactamase class C family)